MERQAEGRSDPAHAGLPGRGAVASRLAGQSKGLSKVVKITFKLYAMLADYLQQEYQGEKRDGNALVLELEPGTTISDLVEQFNLPDKWVHLVLIDGAYIQPEDRPTRPLADGEVLAIWPPVAGG